MVTPLGLVGRAQPPLSYVYKYTTLVTRCQVLSRDSEGPLPTRNGRATDGSEPRMRTTASGLFVGSVVRPPRPQPLGGFGGVGRVAR